MASNAANILAAIRALAAFDGAGRGELAKPIAVRIKGLESDTIPSGRACVPGGSSLSSLPESSSGVISLIIWYPAQVMADFCLAELSSEDL